MVPVCLRVNHFCNSPRAFLWMKLVSLDFISALNALLSLKVLLETLLTYLSILLIKNIMIVASRSFEL